MKPKIISNAYCAYCGGRLDSQIVRDPATGDEQTLFFKHHHYGKQFAAIPQGYVNNQFAALRAAVDATHEAA